MQIVNIEECGPPF